MISNVVVTIDELRSGGAVSGGRAGGRRIAGGRTTAGGGVTTGGLVGGGLGGFGVGRAGGVGSGTTTATGVGRTAGGVVRTGIGLGVAFGGGVLGARVGVGVGLGLVGVGVGFGDGFGVGRHGPWCTNRKSTSSPIPWVGGPVTVVTSMVTTAPGAPPIDTHTSTFVPGGRPLPPDPVDPAHAAPAGAASRAPAPTTHPHRRARPHALMETIFPRDRQLLLDYRTNSLGRVISPVKYI
ncbi:hypothetical protein [Embleya sp. NBC_00896]|uniref:hypothetical protein n=1 Tax=Embleya sp. NBC_00896 TaxID=2975961 RepID=UPI00386F044B|nr:hypothetical protein OG928_07270 [Embleya sp. NBC_00896]